MLTYNSKPKLEEFAFQILLEQEAAMLCLTLRVL
jgi:hypothetical protein